MQSWEIKIYLYLISMSWYGHNSHSWHSRSQKDFFLFKNTFVSSQQDFFFKQTFNMTQEWISNSVFSERWHSRWAGLSHLRLHLDFRFFLPSSPTPHRKTPQKEEHKAQQGNKEVDGASAIATGKTPSCALRSSLLSYISCRQVMLHTASERCVRAAEQMGLSHSALLCPAEAV